MECCNINLLCNLMSIGEQEHSVKIYDLMLECDDKQKPQKGISMESGGLIPTAKISKLGSGNQPLAEEDVNIANTGCWKLISKHIQELLEKISWKKTMIKVILDT